MQFQILSLVFAAAAIANAAAVPGTPAPYSYGPVCTDGTVAVCCQASYGKVDYESCLKAGAPKHVLHFENKCYAKGYGYKAYCCVYSYGEYSDCTEE